MAQDLRCFYLVYIDTGVFQCYNYWSILFLYVSPLCTSNSRFPVIVHIISLSIGTFHWLFSSQNLYYSYLQVLKPSTSLVRDQIFVFYNTSCESFLSGSSAFPENFRYHCLRRIGRFISPRLLSKKKNKRSA